VIKTAAGQALWLLAFAVLPALGQIAHFRDRIPWQKPSGDEVTLEQAREWSGTVLWIDARPEEEFAAAHVPGALLLNTEQWDKLLPKVLDSWSPRRKVVVYCSKQTCGASEEVARRLRDEAGLKDVYVLRDGWEGWQQGAK
jgi:rhodanese-related sulfurtransferase